MGRGGSAVAWQQAFCWRRPAPITIHFGLERRTKLERMSSVVVTWILTMLAFFAFLVAIGLLAARSQEADSNGDRARKLQREVESTRRDAEGMLQVR